MPKREETPRWWSLPPPLLMRSTLPSREKVQERHADGDARLDLVQYDRLRAVGKIVGQLHSPVDRTRVHDTRVFLFQGKYLRVQSVLAGIFPEGRKISGFLPLEVNPEHHNHVGVPYSIPVV